MEAYRIVIPSRKRAFLMPKVRTLLPTATITVDESEMTEYAKVVPLECLVPHPPLPSITVIRNWILDTFTEPCIVMADDDFEFVKVFGRTMRSLYRSADILQLIENQVQVATDLNIGVFGWYPSLVLSSNYFVNDPINVSKSLLGVFGIRGAARLRRFDPKAVGRADIDWFLQAMREDRIVLCDQRFHFSVGINGKTQGGALGLITEQHRKEATDYLRGKWGPFITLMKKGEKVRLGDVVKRRQ